MSLLPSELEKARATERRHIEDIRDCYVGLPSPRLEAQLDHLAAVGLRPVLFIGESEVTTETSGAEWSFVINIPIRLAIVPNDGQPTEEETNR